MCWCFPVKTVYFGTNIKDVLSSPSRRFPRETEQNIFVIRIKRNLFSFFVLFLLCPLGLSEANRVRSPLPSSTSREKISDRHHVGSLFQRSDHLRGPEWKPFSCAQVSLEGHKKDFLYCENLIPILIYHKNSAFFLSAFTEVIISPLPVKEKEDLPPEHIGRDQARVSDRQFEDIAVSPTALL